MWQRLSSAYDDSIESGYKGWRGAGEMTWALRDIAGSDQLIKYESGLNNEMKLDLIPFFVNMMLIYSVVQCYWKSYAFTPI